MHAHRLSHLPCRSDRGDSSCRRCVARGGRGPCAQRDRTAPNSHRTLTSGTPRFSATMYRSTSLRLLSCSGATAPSCGRQKCSAGRRARSPASTSATSASSQRWRAFDLGFTVEQVLAGNYTVDERLTLDVRAEHNGELLSETWALNEATVEKRRRMLEVSVGIDDHPVSVFACDGVVLATPTGSTAYAFSAGGPIVWPSVQALLMVPIAAHALFNKPLVAGPDSEAHRQDPSRKHRPRRHVVRRPQTHRAASWVGRHCAQLPGDRPDRPPRRRTLLGAPRS